MVHADDPDDDRYTFPDGDPPAGADGQVVVEPLQYTDAGEQADGGDLPASGGSPVMPALLVGGGLLLVACAVLVVQRIDGRRA